MNLEMAARSLERMLRALGEMSAASKSSLGDGQDQYQREISGLARKLWSEDITPFEFADNMFSVMRRNFTLAWRDGARIMGVKEIGDEEMLRVQEYTQAQAQYLPNLISFIQANSKANGGKFGSLDTRIAMWANRWREMWNEARLFYAGNAHMKWVMNPEKEHCTDCLMLDGRVYTQSAWDKYGLHPQMAELKCGGYACGCRFVKTTEALTPGHPPALVGKSHHAASFVQGYQSQTH